MEREQEIEKIMNDLKPIVKNMKFDFKIRPMVIDWSGNSGPLIKQKDIDNSVIKRIIRNEHYPPFFEKEYVRGKPWWNPQDPFGSNITTNQNQQPVKFIPGFHPAPAYPQLSTMTRQQHYHGLRVLSTKYKNVQPRTNYRLTLKDMQVFEELHELYEAEQKVFLKWAKLLWVNGDCIRALRPKPKMERVYDAEFRMRRQRIQLLPQKYSLAAQLPLETKTNDFEIEKIEDLLTVNAKDLPLAEYPLDMDKDISLLLKPYPIPEPCLEHPCKFVLPNEDTVSVLPQIEINRELAQYAAANDSSFIASENALQCLLETERSWKLSISVIEVECPDIGDVKTVVVIGSEFGVQKECATQRAYKAYKHLLQQTFVPLTGHYKGTSTEQCTPEVATENATVAKNTKTPQFDSFRSLEDDLAVSSDDNDDKLLINNKSKGGPKPGELDKPISRSPEPYQFNNEPDDELDESGSESDQLMIDVADNINNYGQHPCEPDYSSLTYEARPSCSYNTPHDEPNRLTIEPSNNTYDVKPSNDVSHSKTDKLIINDVDDIEMQPSNCQVSYKPNSNNKFGSKTDKLSIDDIEKDDMETNNILESSKSNNSNNESCSETDQMVIDDVNEVEPNHDSNERNYRDDEPSNKTDELIIDDVVKATKEPNNSQNSFKPNYTTDAYEVGPVNEPSSEPDCMMIDQTGYSNDTSDSESENTITETSNNSNLSKVNVPSKPLTTLFKTNKNADSNSYEKNEVASTNIFESNKDSVTNFFGTNEAAASDLFKTNQVTATNIVEKNEIVAISLGNTNAANSFETNKNAATDTYERNTHQASTSKFKLDSNKPNYTTDVYEVGPVNEPSSEPDCMMIDQTGYSNDTSDSESDTITESCNNSNLSKVNVPSKPLTTLLKTNKNADSNSYEKNDVASTNIFESNKDSVTNFFGTNEAAASDLFKTNQVTATNIVEKNEIVAISLGNTNAATSFEINKNAATDSYERNTHQANTSELKLDSNNEIANDTIQKACDVKPEQPSYSNPCKIRVRNFSISEMKANNFTGLFDGSKITVSSPNKQPLMRNFSETNDNDVLEVTENSNNAHHSRLGISGIITRNQRVSTSDNLAANKAERTFTGPNSNDTNVIEHTTEKTSKDHELSLNPAVNRSFNVTKTNDIQLNYTVNTTKGNSSPVKPCLVPVEKINIKPYIRKLSFSGTNNDGVKEPTKKTNEAKNLVKQTRKRSISSIGTESTKLHAPIITKSVGKLSPKSTRKPSETDIFYASEVQKPNNEETNKVKPVNSLSPLKPCIKNISDPSPSKNSARKLSLCTNIETEDINRNETSDNDKEPVNKRSRKLSDQINIEHDYSQFGLESPSHTSTVPRKRSISEIEHDYCLPDPSLYLDIEPIHKATTTAAKSKPKKVILSELFGEDSDGDEAMSSKTIHSNSDADNDETMISDLETAAKSNDNGIDSNEAIKNPVTRKLSFSNTVDDKLTNKSPLKSCLKNANASESPQSHKRKLSFSDPLTSDPEFGNVSSSDAISEEDICGFHNGKPVLANVSQMRDPKKQSNTCTYNLRRRNIPKPANITKKNIKTDNNKNINLAKITPKSNKSNNVWNDLKTPSISSDTDESESFNNLQNINNKINEHSKSESSLRRSPRIKRLSEGSIDGPQTNKTAETNVKDISENISGLRRSRRLSSRITTSENTQPKSNTIKKETMIFSPSKQSSKIKKKHQIRRKSLPANIFSKIDKTNPMIRSKSLTNLNEIANVPCRRSTRLQEKRTRRYSNRTLDSARSGTDLTESESERHFLRSKPSTCSKTDRSDANNQTKKYSLRSNTSQSIITKNSQICSNRTKNANKISERTERYLRRSDPSFSSSDEMDQPIQARRKKTRKQPESIDHSANNIDSSNQSKLKPMDIAESSKHINYSTNHKTTRTASESIKNHNDIETIEIKIDLYEETNENINNKTEQAFTQHQIDIREMNENQMINRASTSNDLVDINKTKFEDINFSHYTSNKMDVSDSDTENTEFYDSRSYTLNMTEPLTGDAINEIIMGNAISNDFLQAEVNQNQNEDDPDFDVSKSTDHVANSEGLRSRKNSMSDSSDSSDYFNMDETEVLYINHFTARPETESEKSKTENTRIQYTPNEDVQETSITADSGHKETAKDISDDNTRKVHMYGTVEESNDMNPAVTSQTEVIDRSKTNNTTKEVERDRNVVPNSIEISENSHNPNNKNENVLTKEAINDIIGVYNCTCKGTVFEVPPPRSYKKWRVMNKNSHVNFDIIVHSSHKARKGSREVLLEPIVEYQPELGGSKQPEGRLRALALALMLRQTAQLINVRVDYANGNVIVIDKMSNEEFVKRHGDQKEVIADTLHTAVNQLRFLLPGQYVLAHDPSHGCHAMLYSTKGASGAAHAQALCLRADNVNMADAEEAAIVKKPPELEAVLLPCHKRRSTLPLAFTPFENQVREDKKVTAALAKAKHPPNAIMWPKRKRKSKKARQRQQAATSQTPDEE